MCCLGLYIVQCCHRRGTNLLDVVGKVTGRSKDRLGEVHQLTQMPNTQLLLQSSTTAPMYKCRVHCTPLMQSIAHMQSSK